MQVEKQPAQPFDEEVSIAKIGRELRDEFCWLADIGDDGRVPDPASVTHRARRNLVRCVFSFVEALSFVMKANALRHIRANHDQWDASELLIAEELSAEVTEAGRIVKKKAKVRTMSNVRFAFRLLAAAYGADFTLDVNSNGWQCLQRAIRVRDRVTHPKCLSDLTVTESEYSDAIRAFIWFDRQSLRIMEPIARALDGDIAKLRQRLTGIDPIAASEFRGISDESPLPVPPRGLHDDV
ncbi:hypothetical protein [Bryocella elongata]|nr:hypothetical protein [Bryocella elongata]